MKECAWFDTRYASEARACMLVHGQLRSAFLCNVGSKLRSLASLCLQGEPPRNPVPISLLFPFSKGGRLLHHLTPTGMNTAGAKHWCETEASQENQQMGRAGWSTRTIRSCHRSVPDVLPFQVITTCPFTHVLQVPGHSSQKLLSRQILLTIRRKCHLDIGAGLRAGHTPAP
jgi:hypothetical protein